MLRVVADETEPKTAELFRIVVTTPAGAELGRLDVIRREPGWTLGGIADAAWDEHVWWGKAGRALPVPILGTRLVLTSVPVGLERDVLLGACVDIALGLRPYIAEMI